MQRFQLYNFVQRFTAKLSDPLFPACADMRSDVQAIFKMTPHDKQVMMFSATLSAEIRPICKKFMSDVRPSPHGHQQLPAAAAPCALQQHTLHTLNLQAVAPRRPVTVMA